MAGSKGNGSSRTPVRVEELLQALDEAYRKAAWDGPNLRGSLRGVQHREAAWRPAPDRHNIWEVVVHAAYWKYAVRRRIRGEKRGSFPLPGSNWFQRPVKATSAAWKEDLALLEDQHRQLCKAVETLSSRDLALPLGSGERTVGELVRGAAFHDVYHAGQIQLLKRLRRA